MAQAWEQPSVPWLGLPWALRLALPSVQLLVRLSARLSVQPLVRQLELR